MHIISRRILRDFLEKHPDSKAALQTWYHDVERSNWKSPAEIKTLYANASFLSDSRVVFNIKGNHYRIVVVIVFQNGVVFIRFVGTHQEYDRVDVLKV